jgi:hypothetical protein
LLGSCIVNGDFPIRPATPADIGAIAAIYAEAVLHGTATFEIDPPSEAEMARRMAALLAGGYPYFVTENGGAVLGYGYAGAYRPRPAYRVGRGRPTAAPSRIRSISPSRRGAKALAAPCWRR